MTFEEALIEGTAGRHETFTPRYGWIKKGYDRCDRNPHVFNDDNSIEQLGVGKNMVRSIRFWCVLFRVLEEGESPGCLKPSEFGRRLLSDESGWDPFLEDPASLWLLHWQIFKPPFLAVSWNLFFNFIQMPSFSSQDLAKTLVEKTQGIEGFREIAKGSFEKDASCLLRMYSPEKKEKADIRCPFCELGVLETAPERESGNRLRFSTSPKTSLPDLIFLASVFDYAATWHPGEKSLSLQSVAFGKNSPGQVFRLSETECGQRLGEATQLAKSAVFTESNGGIRQIQFREDPNVLACKCLDLYYEGARP
jgi:hypothetical protein